MNNLNTSESLIDLKRSSSSLWSNCRPDIQRRINALLNYQAEYFRLRMQFYRQVQYLQYVYSSKFEEIFERRRKIIDGSCEPTEHEKQINWLNTPIPFVSRISTENMLNDNNNNVGNSLPNFWLTVLKNLDFYDYSIRSRDELCLKYLIDIRCILNRPTNHSSSFILQFHFLPSNPFFNETILTKYYSVRFELDQSNPYRSYDGPEIDQCYGCLITWQSEHNLTFRKCHKRIRNKLTGEIQLLQIEKPVKSFFNFFSPPIIPPNSIDDMSEEDQIRLETDIEFALLLKQRVLPKAILYYTGEAMSLFDEDEEENELTSLDNSE